MQRVKDIMFFKTMITPYLVKGLFWVGLAFAVFSTVMAQADQRLLTAMGSCIFIVLLRIVSEVVLVLFKR